jgi:predicted DNA binding protein
MPLFEVVFKITHDCPFGNISRKFPSLKMFVWCNREHEVIEVIVDKPEEYKAVMKEISKMDGLIEELSDGYKIHLIAKECFCNLENSIGKNIDTFNLLHVLPVVYAQGWEYYRIIAFKHEDVNGLLQRLDGRGFTYEILRKVPFDGFIASSLTLTADALFSSLTEKQIDALLTSFNNGYYNLPRKIPLTLIARKRRVPRTTFEEHLRKAENKLVAGLIPYLQLFKKASTEKRNKLHVA